MLPSKKHPFARGIIPIDFNDDRAVNPIDLPARYERNACLARRVVRNGLFTILRVLNPYGFILQVIIYYYNAFNVFLYCKHYYNAFNQVTDPPSVPLRQTELLPSLQVRPGTRNSQFWNESPSFGILVLGIVYHVR